MNNTINPASNIELSPKEKRNNIIQVWAMPMTILLVLAIIVIFVYYWSVSAVNNAETQKNKLTTALSEVQQRLNKVAIEEQEITAKSQEFLALEKRGLKQPVNQLDIQEYLYGQAKFFGIKEFQYIFGEKGIAQDSLKHYINMAIDKNERQKQNEINLSILSQSLKFEVQHEVQVFDFLRTVSVTEGQSTGRDKLPKSWARINHCEISRINPNGELSPTKSNFKTTCNLDWINLIIPVS